MTDSLIEAMARAMLDWQKEFDREQFAEMGLPPPSSRVYKVRHVEWTGYARAALAAIEASGTHVVVPVKLTQEMYAAASYTMEDGVQSHWDDMLAARPRIET